MSNFAIDILNSNTEIRNFRPLHINRKIAQCDFDENKYSTIKECLIKDAIKNNDFQTIFEIVWTNRNVDTIDSMEKQYNDIVNEVNKIFGFDCTKVGAPKVKWDNFYVEDFRKIDMYALNVLAKSILCLDDIEIAFLWSKQPSVKNSINFFDNNLNVKTCDEKQCDQIQKAMRGMVVQTTLFNTEYVKKLNLNVGEKYILPGVKKALYLGESVTNRGFSIFVDTYNGWEYASKSPIQPNGEIIKDCAQLMQT